MDNLNHQQFIETWRLLGERLFVLKSLSLSHPRGLAECFLVERERSGSREKELILREEIRQIGEAVKASADLVQSADRFVADCLELSDAIHAEQEAEARNSLRQAEPVGSA
ncbi:hypothetical protein [Bradyrhizobium elkanii]|uniref:hypothetical protein n=1 Tax=Bradyrhizobium elkanii TaxID=29448 RepID=UPI00209E0AF3|nr:hypothetical protein [Bradyrhizobium elkanii]MCP1969774.1 hypothetical protein [Bradyrhizobium elkanii]MCS4108718.1 hypothetical protein [Bradyrhizobium elkanii]